MATASSFLSEEHFQCSICLDVFIEPVSIPCGHNFCKACLTRHWEGKEQCQCPLCNEKFNKGLNLRVNTGFREVVENYKKHCVIVNDNSPVRPGQVLCDWCHENKFRATKTCLVCLASLCETHLEPHQRVPTLKQHKLTNPVQNLEDKICKRHNRISEFLCKDDQTRVCVLCTDHSAHATVPLEEDYVDKGAQMGRKEAEVQQIKLKRGKTAQKMKVAGKNKRKGKNEARANSVVSDQMLAPHVGQLHNEDPHHFSGYSYIPTNTGFSAGRFYYVVQVRGRTSWDLGVVRESRRGRRTSTPNRRNENWIVRLGSNTCRALHNRKPERLMVFVDYENGLVSFFDADNAVLIYSFTGCNFRETIFLSFSPGPSEDIIRGGNIWKVLVSFIAFMAVIFSICKN